MCIFRSPPTPRPPPLIAAPPPPPTKQDPAVTQARQRARQQAALAQGRDATVLTNPLGLAGGASSSARKTLLGA